MEGWSSKYPSPLGIPGSSETETQPCSGSRDLLLVLLMDALRVALHSQLCIASPAALGSSIAGKNLAADVTGPGCRGVIRCLRGSKGLELCNGGVRQGINSNSSCADQNRDANMNLKLDAHVKNWVFLGVCWDFWTFWFLNKAPRSTGHN